MFTVLAFADEICAHPTMLRDWVKEFGNDPRFALLAYAPGRQTAQVHADLDRAFARFGPGASPYRQQVQVLVSSGVDPDSATASGLSAYYSNKPRRATFSHLPRISRGCFRALRALCGAFKDKCQDPDGPPDFVGVAAQKSGTTWWGELINRHPGVHRSPRVRKEAHFFTVFEGFPVEAVPVERYSRMFPRPAGTITGEWTPGYIRAPAFAAMLKRAAPDTKILAMLRDPIERYISGLTQRRRHGGRLGLAAQNLALEAGLYGQQLEGLLTCFRREQVLVLQYERCCLSPASELKKTYEFLGLPNPDFVPDDLSTVIHATDVEKVPLSAETRNTLAEIYRTDGARLAELFPQIDLGLWTSLKA